MNVCVRSARLAGKVRLPSSKSMTHRLLICSALADRPTDVYAAGTGEDIDATLHCLSALGAEIQPFEGGFRVFPLLPSSVQNAQLDCRESGSTLRFLMPVAAALGVRARWLGGGRLPERPVGALMQALKSHGIRFFGDRLPLEMSGRLSGGNFEIPGDISSQFITGLLLALPLCGEDSRVLLSSPLASAPYVDMTLECLGRFGISVRSAENGYFVGGGQRFVSPGDVTAPADTSAAAVWLGADFLGSETEFSNLSLKDTRGDGIFPLLLSRIGGTIDVSDTPDLVPLLAVCAGTRPLRTEIIGAGRLRLKESDRLAAVKNMLLSLGARAEETPDGLVIQGVSRYNSCRIEGKNDHRIVMAASVAALWARGEVTVTDAEAVSKSYPSFFEEWARLGGSVRREA